MAVNAVDACEEVNNKEILMNNKNLLKELNIIELEERVEFGLCGGSGGDDGGTPPGDGGTPGDGGCERPDRPTCHDN